MDINTYAFEQVAELKLKSLGYAKREQGMKWLGRILTAPSAKSEELEDVIVFLHCFEHGYKIPKELKEAFAELIRDAIALEVNGITFFTNPSSAVDAVHNANLYVELYDAYAI